MQDKKSKKIYLFHIELHCEVDSVPIKAPCPLSRVVPRPSFPTGVVGQSTVCRTGGNYNRVRWPVSKKSVSTKPIFVTYVSLPFDVRQEKRLSGQGH